MTAFLIMMQQINSTVNESSQVKSMTPQTHKPNETAMQWY